LFDLILLLIYGESVLLGVIVRFKLIMLFVWYWNYCKLYYRTLEFKCLDY